MQVEAAFVLNRRGPTLESPSELRESASPRRDKREARRLAPVTERVEPRDEGDAEVDGQHAVHEPLAPAKHRPRRDSSLADGAPPRQGPRTSKVSQPPRDATRPPAAPRRVHPRVPRGVELDVSDPRERFPERHPQRAALAYASRPRVEKIRGVSVQPSRQQPMRRLPLGRSTHHRVRPPVERGRDSRAGHAADQVRSASLRGAPFPSPRHRVGPRRKRDGDGPVRQSPSALLKHRPHPSPLVHRLDPTLERVGQREPEPATHHLLHASKERSLRRREISPRGKGGVRRGADETRDCELLTLLGASVRAPAREPRAHLAAARTTAADGHEPSPLDGVFPVGLQPPLFQKRLHAFLSEHLVRHLARRPADRLADRVPLPRGHDPQRAVLRLERPRPLVPDEEVNLLPGILDALFPLCKRARRFRLERFRQESLGTRPFDAPRPRRLRRVRPRVKRARQRGRGHPGDGDGDPLARRHALVDPVSPRFKRRRQLAPSHSSREPRRARL